MLGASSTGKQVLDMARKQRTRQVGREDFRTQNKFLTEEAARLSGIEGKTISGQDVRKRIAQRVAAGENPTLAERLQGTAAGIEPAQVARSRAEASMESQNKAIPDLMRSIEKILNQLSSAPLVTSGGK